MKNRIKIIINRMIYFILKLPLVGKLFDRNFVLYAFIGVTGVTIDFLIFTFLVKVLGLYYVISNLISVSFGLVNNFILNRRYNFKVYNKPVHRFMSFYFIGITGIAISTLLIHVLTETLSIPVLVSKIISVIIVVILQYIANRFITFR
jgi:putative flippase GtrA